MADRHWSIGMGSGSAAEPQAQSSNRSRDFWSVWSRLTIPCAGHR